MRKRILLITIFCFVVCAGHSFANMMNYYYAPNGIETVSGTIQETGFNSIVIYDEERKRLEKFVYLQNERFNKGDYVRIYYHPRGAIVAMIKRMAVLEYKANGQNLGNISHVDNRRN